MILKCASLSCMFSDMRGGYHQQSTIKHSFCIVWCREPFLQQPPFLKELRTSSIFRLDSVKESRNCNSFIHFYIMLEEKNVPRHVCFKIFQSRHRVVFETIKHFTNHVFTLLLLRWQGGSAAEGIKKVLHDYM